MATEVKYEGIGFGGLLAVLFIGLKLTGVIAWSWWWVLSPLWLPLALMLGIFVVGLIFAGILLGIAALMGR
jgi:hypothetical protein